MFLVAGIILFILLIVVHEYGHFLVAKRNGVEVEEFGIGFPPKIAGKTIGKGIFRSYYTINLLPLGGFVKLKGESNDDKRPNSFGKASFKAKMKIMLAGVVMNYLVGVLLFAGMAYSSLPVIFDDHNFVGAQKESSLEGIFIGEVVENEPADKAGIETGDQIVKFAGESVGVDADKLQQLIDENKGKEVVIEYKDYSNSDQEVSTNLKLNNDGDIVLGVGYGSINQQAIVSKWWSAPINGFLYANDLVVGTFKAIGGSLSSLLAGDAEEAGQNVAGPVGIVRALTDVDSFKFLIFITANLSIALAVANLLPIPGLDGGRFYTILIFKILNKDLSKKTETIINAAGMSVLLLLVILITISDITK